MQAQTITQHPSKAKNIALWCLQVLVALAFLAAGAARLSGQPMMVEVFDKIGVGQWFRYVTGGIEITSAVLLLVPGLIPVGAGLLVCTMIGAVIAHLTILGGTPLPPAVLGVLAAVILWGRFETVKAWLGGPTKAVASE